MQGKRAGRGDAHWRKHETEKEKTDVMKKSVVTRESGIGERTHP